MAGKFFILRQVADFAPGLFENTAMEDGCVILSHRAGSYIQSGQYTSPPYGGESFFSLIASWNADTPPGTSVEMQVRVSSDGQWSGWLSFGRWSPYIDRGSAEVTEDEVARVEAEALRVRDGRPPADLVQMRMLLFTNSGDATPRVRLMAVSTDAIHQMGAEPRAYDRTLELPAYSCLTREPALSGHIAGVTSLTMMMNRWGRDLLPEEVARVCYDNTSSRFGNLSFLCAAAGVYGFVSHVAYAGIPALRREVWQGRCVAARVHYRAPSLSAADTARADGQAELPVLKGAVTGSNGHLVAVRGFTRVNGEETVLLHDPIAPTDGDAYREIPLADFAKLYTGLALFMEKGAKGSGARPARRLCGLRLEDGFVRIFDGETELDFERLRAEGQLPATVCYTLSEGIVYASAAQRKFYYPTPDENGRIRADLSGAAGRRMTFYLIGARGAVWVAEARLEKPAEEE